MAVNASQSISVSASSSVESGQDIDLPTIRFTNMEDLFNVVNHTDGDFLAVTRIVSPFNCYIAV
jgi:predicted transcriptional regulator